MVVVLAMDMAVAMGVAMVLAMAMALAMDTAMAVAMVLGMAIAMVMAMPLAMGIAVAMVKTMALEMDRRMNIFFIADTHFSHRKLADGQFRPWDNIHKMNDALIEAWNTTVTNDDVVYHLGDVSFAPFDVTCQFLHELNGTICLVRGNHDRGTSSCYSQGFDLVTESVMIKSNGVHFHLSHYPTDPLVLPTNCWNIHGHTHHKGLAFDEENRRICVSVERTNYQPLPLSLIHKSIKRKRLLTSFP